ncbi:MULTISPECIES: hypothetical protein [unclassified Streptomyces]|uniref:hypothetical protein n=1 Tax=unclassified Streptomyces TaxID=2593676 RepID=UPI0035DABDC4
MNDLERPVAELPIQVFPRPCEGPESFISRLAQANYLKPAYLNACLSEPPTERGTLSWPRLAAAAGRDHLELQEVLERTPPPPPDLLLCEYCGRPPKPNVQAELPPWLCSAPCRRRNDLLKRAPSSNGILPDQKHVLPCPGCGAQFIRPATSPRSACTPRCHARNTRAQQAELALYENPDAVEDEPA